MIQCDCGSIMTNVVACPRCHHDIFRLPSKELWIILIPSHTQSYTLANRAYFIDWCEKVYKIAGGLTVLSEVQGQWFDKKTKKLVEEWNQEIQIGCTKNQIEQIADMTAVHYQQKAVMYYKISDFVKIKEYDK